MRRTFPETTLTRSNVASKVGLVLLGLAVIGGMVGEHGRHVLDSTEGREVLRVVPSDQDLDQPDFVGVEVQGEFLVDVDQLSTALDRVVEKRTFERTPVDEVHRNLL